LVRWQVCHEDVAGALQRLDSTSEHRKVGHEVHTVCHDSIVMKNGSAQNLRVMLFTDRHG
jgi:hypothetical protein